MKKFFLILLIILVVLGVGGYVVWRMWGPSLLFRFFSGRGGGGFPALENANPLEKVPEVNPAAKTNPFEGVKTNPFE
ncbi:MAG: hypothetical protein AAB634_01360 [Patescibacteria group bacterium]